MTIKHQLTTKYNNEYNKEKVTWMPHNSIIKCIEISNNIECKKLIANMQEKGFKSTAFIHFPVTDKDLDTTRGKKNSDSDQTSQYK